jgi:osmotically-inducible protein OsmY
VPRQLCSLGLSFILTAGLAACADFKCAPEYCQSDAKITEEVQAVFNEHAEFGPPGELRVHTINGVVYLNGLVNSEMERRTAEAFARQVPKVKDVVNSLSPRNGGDR